MAQKGTASTAAVQSKPLAPPKLRPVTFSALKSPARTLDATLALSVKVESNDDVLKVTSYVTSSNTIPSIPLALVGLPTSLCANEGVERSPQMNAKERKDRMRNLFISSPSNEYRELRSGHLFGRLMNRPVSDVNT